MKARLLGRPPPPVEQVSDDEEKIGWSVRSDDEDAQRWALRNVACSEEAACSRSSSAYCARRRSRSGPRTARAS